MPASGDLGGTPYQDPPVARPQDNANENADWEDYWVGKMDALKEECQAEFQLVDDVVHILDQKIDGQKVVLEDVQKKWKKNVCLWMPSSRRVNFNN